jgi:serine/threonine protein kinase
MDESGITRIGHYILGKTIGSGGFAKVKCNGRRYLRYGLLHIQEAQHDLTGVKVGVKILNKARMENSKMISKVAHGWT